MPAVKRKAPASPITRRRSGRLSGVSKKSKYFEESSEDELATPVKATSSRGRRVTLKSATSEDEHYQEEYGGDEPELTDAEGQVGEVEDEEERPRQRGRAKQGKPAKGRRKSLKEELEEADEYVDDTGGDVEEADDDGDADDDDDDDDAPPKVVILPLVKLRDDGGVEYEDEKVHQNTLLFLKDLKSNNRREWLKSHDGEYRRALKDWQSFVESATSTIIDIDETIPELPVKDVIFRIHRDIRFSKDATPYKPHFSAAWSRTGRKGPYACYYIHCEPRAAFIGGGLWHPEKGHIDKIRRSVDRHPRRWRAILNDPGFRAVFFPNLKGGEEAAVKAFLEKNKESALKKKPKDYAADHRDIGLLRLRNYTIGTKITDDLFLSDDAQQKIADIMQPLSRYVTFLNSIVMPDPSLDDDSDSSEEGEQDQANEDE